MFAYIAPRNGSGIQHFFWDIALLIPYYTQLISSKGLKISLSMAKTKNSRISIEIKVRI